MSVDWGLEYLRGIFPPTGPEQSARAQNPPEKPAVAVPANNQQEVNTSEIQKSQAPPQLIPGRANPNAVVPVNHLQQSHNGHADARELLDSIVAYLRKYLVCDDHQYTVLALWIIHTWTFRHFHSVAYLEIRSPEPQSGKTLCLQLLEPLCNDSFFAGGLEPASMIYSMLINDEKMDRKYTNPSFLFDDCQHTFAPSERQRVVALLNSGSRLPCLYMDRTRQYDPFNPKAFATSVRLPRSLAARCIPIILRRRKPSETVARFTLEDAEPEFAALKQVLENWVEAHKDLFQGAKEKLPTLPPGFTARQQECSEPLVYIADIAGGEWSRRARTALRAVFEVADCSEGFQMLSDIRSMFHLRNNPEQLSTKDVLAELITHENRPWGGWHLKAGQKLAGLLSPFGISPQTLWQGTDSYKGYKLKNFQEAWERYLPPLPVAPQQPETAEGQHAS